MSESGAGAAALDERYGRRGIRRGPWLAVIAGGVLVAAAVAWFVWARPIGVTTAIEWTDLAHSIDSDASATVTWRLVVEPGREVSCAVNAMNTSYGIVGWRVVDVPASTEALRDLTETLRTTERASTAFVYRCWLA